MYMYLSDRIRRMFLSGACPQNISPKKPLSLKDQRFLQKNVADKNLSRILVKQQKLLYEKHIGLLLQEKKAYNSNLKPLLYQKKTKNKGETYYFSKNSEGLFVQNIKVQKEKQDGLFDIKNAKRPVNQALQNLVLLEKSRILNISKASNPAKKTTHARSTGYADTPFINVTPAKPLFVKDESNYTNCRYLYDHESLKTSIVPQIFKNQKPISRAKTLLHERKKIALLYGQLAKKDIINISKKALSIPGFFEDNMFTLLESRVDVCIFRAGFSKTIAGARQLVRNGSVLVNGEKIYSCKRKAKPGDYFSFTKKQTLLNPYHSVTLELYHLCLSSNFLREWLFLNKKVFLWQLSFRNQYPLTGLERKKKRLLLVPEWLLLLFFSLPSKKSYKPGFCSSLYWGFFLYKLKKMPVFSFFFEPKKKANKRLNAFEKDSFNGIFPSPLKVGKGEKTRKLWHKTMAEKSLPLGTLVARKLCLKQFALIKKKAGVLLNVYTQLLLKKQKTTKKPCSNFAPYRGFSSNLSGLESIVPLQGLQSNSYDSTGLAKPDQAKHGQRLFFRNKVPLSNLWAIWGQKPLHLEISHKTGAFIYMYKPQKMISPVCLNFKP